MYQKMTDTCEALYFADQTKACRKCGLYWDANDPDPPECLTDQQIGNNAIREIKKDMDDD